MEEHNNPSSERLIIIEEHNNAELFLIQLGKEREISEFFDLHSIISSVKEQEALSSSASQSSGSQALRLRGQELSEARRGLWRGELVLEHRAQPLINHKCSSSRAAKLSRAQAPALKLHSSVRRAPAPA